MNTFVKTSRVLRKMQMQTIMSVTCDVLGVDQKDVMLGERKKELVEVRHMFCYVTRRLTQCPMSDIAKTIGKSIQAVSHNILACENLMQTEPFFYMKVKKIEQICKDIV